MGFRRSFAFRLLSLFLPLAVVVTAAAWAGYRAETLRRHASHESRERSRVEAGVVSLGSSLESIRGDLRYLIAQLRLRHAVEAPGAEALERMAQDWVGFSRAKPVYDQIRWLDETGMERIRINQGGGTPVIVPQSQLQNKADRYYFVEAQALKEEGIYVSPLDLNVENGQIERPLKPTIRVASPVRDSQGRRRGIVILNYRGDTLLSLYAKATGNHLNRAWLTNTYGYWLKATNPEEEWGFQLGRPDLSVARRHPDAWERILTEEQGQFPTPEGLWTFRTVVPFRDQADAGPAPFGVPTWKSISLLPHANYNGGLAGLATVLKVSVATILLLWFLGCWRLVRAQIAEEKVRTGLEDLIAERTRDLDEKNHALAASLKESQRLGTALHQAAESVLITDAGGTIQYVNPAFTAVTGYEFEEAVGAAAGALLRSGKHDADFYEAIRTAVAAGKIWKGRVINRRKDGRLITEDTTISPVVDASGAIRESVTVSQDITAELERESQYRQAQKMDAVGRLAGGVAHDFNNLLIPILVNSDLLLQRPDPDPQLTLLAAQISEAAGRAKRIVQQLLAFSRKQTLVLEPTDLNQVVVHFNQLLTRILHENVEVHTVLAEHLPLVRADAGQIEQIIMNLAINAQDAMPHGGRLTFSTEMAELDEAYVQTHPGVAPGSYAMLAVSDTGHGMAPETFEKIFEPFFTTKDKSKGTGLGLSTVFGIVQQHRGSIWVYSEPHHGTVFKIYLPLAKDLTLPVAAPPAEPERVRGTETILIVEDDTAVRDLATRILRQQGYTALAARDGQEALELLAGEGASSRLMVVDVILPGMNGRDLYALAATRIPGLRVLYMSGYTDNIIGEDELLDPKTPFLQKPFSIAGLTAKVRAALDA
ncbi:ATP-binding protein [Geothrix sp. 21YS21S-4]|uniref:ATP-binding protein n=1 Tax=Geothrix sp. 21YS21S-4 TaxID=3068889 RepID=UPI0027BA1478|nr:ATP-binding protein [Geothrix sp. 21YS21S-4]